MGHTYNKVIDGKERSFWSVTGLIDLFNELQFFEKRTFYHKAQVSAEKGNQAHDLIEKTVTGWKIPKRVWNRLDYSTQQVLFGLIRWLRKTKFKVKYTNLKVYCARFGFAGTIDAVGYIAGHLVLLDWKTGLVVLEQLKMQLVLYYIAYLETFPRRRIGSLRGVYFDRKTGAFREIILTDDDIKETIAKFEEYLGKIDVKLLQSFGNLDDLNFRTKNIGGVQVTTGRAIMKTQERGLIKEASSYNNAMEILATWYPYAPNADKMKAAQLIWYHKVPPNKIYLIPYKNNARAEAMKVPCNCRNFTECVHKESGIYDWATVIAIDAKRIIASEGRALQYAHGGDAFPRPMTEAEEIKHYKSVNTEKVRAICIIRDAKSGAIGFGKAELLKTVTVQGRDKGNSVENMAGIRAESQALSRLPGVKLPDMDVVDERYVEEEPVSGGYKGIIEELIPSKGELAAGTLPPKEDKPLETNQGSPGPTPELAQRTDDANGKLIKTCPVHNVNWRPDKWQKLFHYIGPVENKEFCKFKDVAKSAAIKELENKGIPASDLDILIDEAFQSTWNKITPDGCIKIIENVRVMPVEKFPYYKFVGDLAKLLQGLGWTEATLRAEKPNFTSAKDLTGPQRKDLLNHLIDKLAEKGK